MAAITVGGGNFNPTSSYVPYRYGNTWSDSVYREQGTQFGSSKAGDFEGFYGDTLFSTYYMGADALGGYIKVDAQGKIIELVGDSVQYTGATLQSATAGGSAGSHLVISLNGNIRKIALLLP